ncbi:MULTISPECIES: Ger(x)C family spore germination protein [Bacillaceae]|uniref:Ger(X)C family spore germination protein n=1 Tax=Evansella alkalicola TaxID=745819 RepID=A0ABS6JQU1_9BACI|nr:MULTISPECIES: Ger(x)C family spore germination protein [Bacillaceae]MBU9720926.1 Ger(x)C family spore germination protein [Bacillus alkalicola]
MKRLFSLYIMLVLLLTGCINDFEQPTIENYGMVGVMGFDMGEEEGHMKVTLTLPQPEKDAETKVQKFTVEVESPHRAIMEGSTKSEKLLSTAQLRVILFSEEFAREVGVWEVLENLYRDPRVGTNSYLAVVGGGTVEDLLNSDYHDKPDINRYLNQLLKPSTITAFSPFTTIHHFIRHVTSQVSDSLAPYIEKSGDSIKLTKVALFKEDKFISTIEREEAKIVESIKRNRKTSDISYNLPNDGENEGEDSVIVLNFIRSSRNIKTNGDPNNPEIYIYLYITGAVVDYTGKSDLSVHGQRGEVEEKLSNAIEESLLGSLNKFQELRIDPIAIGDNFRKKDRSNWSKEYWNDIFQRANITVHVEPRITSTGTIH